MKKTSIYFFILFNLLINFPACSQNVLPPVWSDYCPRQYMYADNQNKGIINNLVGGFFGLLFGTNESQNKVYWNIRKNEFYQQVNYCNSLENKKDCFEEMKNKEALKSLEYYQNSNNENYENYETKNNHNFGLNGFKIGI